MAAAQMQVRPGRRSPGRYPSSVARPQRIIPQNVAIVAMTTDTITVSQRGRDDKMLPMAANMAIHRLKSIPLSEIKEPSWVWVHRNRIANQDSMTSTVEVARMVVAAGIPKTTEEKMRGRMMGVARHDGAIVQEWAVKSGMLTIADSLPVFEADAKTYRLQFSPGCAIYQQVPMAKSDLKVGDIVDLDLRRLNNAWAIAGINVRPQDDASTGTRQSGQ
ncbi:MAG: hypothetical protein ABFD69_01285 [Candidatus Sumerlaeia bacterium]